MEKKWEAEAAQAAAAEAEEESSAEAVTPEVELAGVETLVSDLNARTKELEEYKDRVLRLRAEFDNYRKRTLREADQLRKTAAADLIRDLFPVLDNLDRALSHAQDASGSFAEGVAMVCQQFRGVLNARGVESIPALEQPFNPEVHEALAQMPAEQPAGIVIQEFERGYRIGEYVLRPAKVIVSSGPPQPPEGSGTDAAGTAVNDNAKPAEAGESPAAE